MEVITDNKMCEFNMGRYLLFSSWLKDRKTALLTSILLKTRYKIEDCTETATQSFMGQLW